MAQSLISEDLKHEVLCYVVSEIASFLSGLSLFEEVRLLRNARNSMSQWISVEKQVVVSLQKLIDLETII